MIIGRGIADVRRRTPRCRAPGAARRCRAAARAAVWEAYEDYSPRMGKARLTFWPELRRDALLVLRGRPRSLRYDAVVADEAQDLGAAAVRMLAEISGGLPAPNLTLVGDGQQAIYPGGFSLLQMGIDVRGRSTVLRTNWRNTYAIWMAAQAFIEGEQFDDLEEESSAGARRRGVAAADARRDPARALGGRRRRRGGACGRGRARGARARRRSRGRRRARADERAG